MNRTLSPRTAGIRRSEQSSAGVLHPRGTGSTRTRADTERSAALLARSVDWTGAPGASRTRSVATVSRRRVASRGARPTASGACLGAAGRREPRRTGTRHPPPQVEHLPPPTANPVRPQAPNAACALPRPLGARSARRPGRRVLDSPPGAASPGRTAPRASRARRPGPRRLPLNESERLWPRRVVHRLQRPVVAQSTRSVMIRSRRDPTAPATRGRRRRGFLTGWRG